MNVCCAHMWNLTPNGLLKDGNFPLLCFNDSNILLSLAYQRFIYLCIGGKTCLYYRCSQITYLCRTAHYQHNDYIRHLTCSYSNLIQSSNQNISLELPSSCSMYTVYATSFAFGFHSVLLFVHILLCSHDAILQAAFEFVYTCM